MEGLVDWWIGGLVDWLIGGLVDWWIGGLVDWWIGGLAYWLKPTSIQPYNHTTNPCLTSDNEMVSKGVLRADSVAI